MSNRSAFLFIIIFLGSVLSSRGSFAQQVTLGDGTFSTPSLAFNSELTLGMYRNGPGQLQFAGSSDICRGCSHGEALFSIRGVLGDRTGYWLRLTHTDDDVIAPHLQIGRDGGVHVTHYLQVSNDFWVGPPHWAHPVYSDGVNEVGAMIISDPDITGYQAGATFVAFGLPSYRKVTGVLPSLFQGYGNVTLSAGAVKGRGQLTGTKVFDVRDDGALQLGEKPFDSLPESPNGTMYYCPDCTYANPCAGGGTGAFAKRLNDAWRCD